MDGALAGGDFTLVEAAGAAKEEVDVVLLAWGRDQAQQVQGWRASGLPLILLVRQGEADQGAAGLREGGLALLQWPCSAQLLRAQLEAALNLKRRLDAWAELAYVDEVTGVANRRALQKQLATELSAAHRHGYPLSFAMIDIDQFKNVNDTYGHPFGDWVLRQVAGRIQEQVRQEDIVGRYGGEEFGVIMPFTDGASAGLVALRILQAVCQAPLEAGDRRVEVRISVGTASMPADAETGLVEMADRRLYRAKNLGGGQVVEAD